MNIRGVTLSLSLFLIINTTSIAQCDSSLWQHVYHSYRLAVHSYCMEISGTVQHLIYEADGDIHIRLTLDPPFTSMLNSVNNSQQYGCLVLEPICATTITQADAVAPCSGLTNTVYIPAVGEHVHVTGSYVTDNDHGWNEIHPVTKIVINPYVEGLNNIEKNSPTLSVSPNPARSFVNFNLSEKTNVPVFITISDEIGRLAGQYQMMSSTNLHITTTYLPEGKYYYHALQGAKEIGSGVFVVLP